MKRRVLIFAIAVVAAITALVWVGASAWRAADQLGRRLSEEEVRSFQVGDTFSADLHELRSLFRRYEATREIAYWERFKESELRLGRWITEQRESVPRPEERELLGRISTTFTEYGRECRELATIIASGATHDQVAPRIAVLGDLAADMAQDTRQILRIREQALNTAASGARVRINGLVRIVAATLVALLLLSITLAAFVYRDLIQPLRRQLVETRNQMVRQEKLASLGVLAAGVAHEIRNPLTAIKARLFTQQRRLPTGSPAAEDAAIISSEILRLERIVREFLDFARPSEPSLVPIDGHALLEEVRTLITPALRSGSSNVQLTVEPGPKVPLLADPAQLKQVLINLVQNAVDAVGTSGHIRLRTNPLLRRYAGRPAAVIEVEDDGPGIVGEARERLFDPFFTTKPDGTGLGLAIAARIIERHGGTLEFRTTPGEGTTFGIILPTPT